MSRCHVDLLAELISHALKPRRDPFASPMVMIVQLRYDIVERLSGRCLVRENRNKGWIWSNCIPVDVGECTPNVGH